ncbi:nucleotidyltransferase domain-containing protein [Dactylosporangium sp. CA-139066]|uniref:nucleotidyltransferase domain-containing protein n=1 Tax=Dactylosporangium sp. CA-139066 TaxID=3239930 RepID=UPI003D8AC6B1
MIPAFGRTFVHRLRPICDPRMVLLFGSWAKGTATVHSDVDLVAVLDAPPSPALRAEMLDALRCVPMRVDLLIWTDRDLDLARRDPHGIQASVLSSAVVLYTRRTESLPGLGSGDSMEDAERT